jgi:hypothetical protein
MVTTSDFHDLSATIQVLQIEQSTPTQQPRNKLPESARVSQSLYLTLT